MATDLFLKVDGIDGESPDKDHQNEIEVSSWSHGMSNPGNFGSNAGGGGGGHVAMQDMTFSIPVCKASPMLMKACASGQPIDTITLTNRATGGAGTPYAYLVITLTNSVISSYHAGTSNGADRATDSFSVNYGEIKYEYSTQANDGSVSAVPSFHYSNQQNAVL